MDIQQILTDYVSDELLEVSDPVGGDENLLSDDMVDSLGMLQLVGFIEATFDVKIAPDQFTIENFRTLDVITAYLSRLIQGRKSAPHD